MNTAWLVYLLSATGVWLFAVYGMRKFLPMVHTLLIGLLLAALLLTPVGVPESSKFSPAWLAAIYETLFGSAEEASRAFRPLLWSLGLTLLPVIGFLAWRVFGTTSPGKPVPEEYKN